MLFKALQVADIAAADVTARGVDQRRAGHHHRAGPQPIRSPRAPAMQQPRSGIAALQAAAGIAAQIGGVVHRHIKARAVSDDAGDVLRLATVTPWPAAVHRQQTCFLFCGSCANLVVPGGIASRSCGQSKGIPATIAQRPMPGIDSELFPHGVVGSTRGSTGARGRGLGADRLRGGTLGGPRSGSPCGARPMVPRWRASSGPHLQPAHPHRR